MEPANGQGQLGIGNVTHVIEAVQFVPPLICRDLVDLHWHI